MEILVFGSNGIVGSHSEPLVKTEGIIVGEKAHMGKCIYQTLHFSQSIQHYVDNL
jgi:type I restriction enzyme S subunit